MKRKKKSKKKASKKQKQKLDVFGNIEIKEIPVKPPKIKSHYIDNKKFYEEMVKWKEQVKEAREVGDTIPPVSEYTGTASHKTPSAKFVIRLADQMREKSLPSLYRDWETDRKSVV